MTMMTLEKPEQRTFQATRGELTPRQQEVYAWLVEFARDHGYPPTVRDIGRGLDIASPNGVMCHLKALEKKGYLRRGRASARAIAFIAERDEVPMRDLLEECAAALAELPTAARLIEKVNDALARASAA